MLLESDVRHEIYESGIHINEYGEKTSQKLFPQDLL